MHPEFFAYYRVSTNRQGMSGLGLEAQRDSVRVFRSANPGKLLGEFTEIESGRKSDRPQLKEALQSCREHGATLLIAKLDRLARNVHVISGLLESDVKFVAIDMPNADRFMLHVYAAMAEEEARRISERTKAALKAAKSRGVQLGKNGSVLGKVRSREADERAERIGPKIMQMKQSDGMSFREIAAQLNELGLKTEKGAVWHPTTVYRAYNRYQALYV